MVSSGFAFNQNELPGFGNSKPVDDSASPNPWIINPIVDFIFVYGGAFWILFVLHVAFFDWNAANIENLRFSISPGVDWGLSQWFVIMGVATPVLISNAHTWATYMRIYGTAEDRERFRFYGKYLIYMPIILFTAAIIFPPLQGYVIYLHMGWVFQHYTSQTYGVGLIYCYKRDYIMNKREKQIYKTLLTALSLFVITGLLSMRSHVPGDMWGVPLPFFNLPPVIHYASQAFLAVMAVAFTGSIINKYIRDKQMIPMPLITMVLGIFVLGTMSGYGSLIAWLWAPPFLHGAQYCLISLSYYLKERGLPEGLTSRDLGRVLLTKPALTWIAWILIGGNFIYIVIPHIMADFGWSFMAMVAVIQACVNFHHFLTDAAIWKLRDSKTRQILVS